MSEACFLDAWLHARPERCPEAITGRANPIVKWIRHIELRSERDRTQLHCVDGLRLVTEAVRRHAPVRVVLNDRSVTANGPGRDAIRHARGCGIPEVDVSSEVLASIANRGTPSGAAAVVRQRWEKLAAVVPADELCWVALEATQ